MTYQYTPESNPGQYQYRLTVVEQSVIGLSKCRIASKPILINIYPTPVVDAGPDRVLLQGDTMHLQGNIQGTFNHFYWSPPDYLSISNALNPVASPPRDYIYTLNAESKYNCKNSDNVKIQVISDIYVPTAFTPNNDGKNDRWHIPFLDPSVGAIVNVYNRYGQIVYQANGIVVDWDGTINGIPQPSGTYIYVIKFKKSWHDLKGTVTLLR
jgi:gliding motility-associated-like protein